MTTERSRVDPCAHCELAQCRLHNAAFCSGLSQDERAKLNAIAHLRHFEKGATVLAVGEEAAIIGNVVEGVLKMLRTDAEGREQIVGLLVPTDMFGRMFSGVSDFAIEAATDATLCCFDRKRFEALVVEHPHLEHEVMLAILDELDAAREWITLLGGQTVAQKLAGFLLLLCRRWPYMGCALAPDREHVEINVPIGRSDLAQYLGTTVETISRTVQGLDRQGILKVITPSRLMVRDMEGLIALSGNTDFDAESVLKRVAGAA